MQSQKVVAVAAKAKVRVLVAGASNAGVVKQVTSSPVKALAYEGCSCWAHN